VRRHRSRGDRASSSERSASRRRAASPRPSPPPWCWSLRGLRELAHHVGEVRLAVDAPVTLAAPAPRWWPLAPTLTVEPRGKLGKVPRLDRGCPCVRACDDVTGLGAGGAGPRKRAPRFLFVVIDPRARPRRTQFGEAVSP